MVEGFTDALFVRLLKHYFSGANFLVTAFSGSGLFGWWALSWQYLAVKPGAAGQR